MDKISNKIRWNTLSFGLSRRRQGFESPWGRQNKKSGQSDIRLPAFLFLPAILLDYTINIAIILNNDLAAEWHAEQKIKAVSSGKDAVFCGRSDLGNHES